jgi:hypothetical protein
VDGTGRCVGGMGIPGGHCFVAFFLQDMSEVIKLGLKKKYLLLNVEVKKSVIYQLHKLAYSSF